MPHAELRLKSEPKTSFLCCKVYRLKCTNLVVQIINSITCTIALVCLYDSYYLHAILHVNLCGYIIKRLSSSSLCTKKEKFNTSKGVASFTHTKKQEWDFWGVDKRSRFGKTKVRFCWVQATHRGTSRSSNFHWKQEASHSYVTFCSWCLQPALFFDVALTHIYKTIVAFQVPAWGDFAKPKAGVQKGSCVPLW